MAFAFAALAAVLVGCAGGSATNTTTEAANTPTTSSSDYFEPRWSRCQLQLREIRYELEAETERLEPLLSYSDRSALLSTVGLLSDRADVYREKVQAPRSHCLQIAGACDEKVDAYANWLVGKIEAYREMGVRRLAGESGWFPAATPEPSIACEPA